MSSLLSPWKRINFFFLCMIVPRLDSDALAVLFLNPVTLAVEGEHVGECLVTEIGAVAVALGSFANGVQVLSFHSVASRAGRAGGWTLWVGSVLLQSVSGGGKGCCIPSLGFCLSWTSERL